jgi:cobalt-zinc-cadmium efflux system membrane fusion protein
MKSKILWFVAFLSFLYMSALSIGCVSTKDSETFDYSVSLTEWSKKLEVFMEYKIPTPGEEISFGVHLTDGSDFKPITEGTLALIFVNRNSGQKAEARAEYPLRDGIFSPKHTFTDPGDYDFSLSLESQKVTDTMDLGTLEVFEYLSPPENDERKTGDEVSFLKEQQWKMEFRVEPIQKRTITQTISVPGKIAPAVYRMAKISPPLDGKITLDKNIILPRQGDRVKSGDVLAIIEPSLASFSNSDVYQIDLEVKNSETKFKLAQSEEERLRVLYEKEAVPKKRLLEAEAGLNIAEANYNKALKKKAAFQNIKLQPSPDSESPNYYIRTPIDGRIVDLTYMLGEQVKAGDTIMTVLDDSKVWLDIAVFENDITTIKNSAGGYFTLIEKSRAFDMANYDGDLIFFGSVINEDTRTVSVIYEISNPTSEFLVGSFITAYLNTAENIETIGIPKSAVFDSGGNKVCFVQLEGETFERRVLELGIEGQDYFQVLNGLEAKEKIVVKGGYAIKLAAESSSKDVGEGHYH